MSKHTPGPWFVFNGTDIFTGLGAKNAAGDECEPNDGWLIADAGITDLNYDEVMANARLIAAAPKLLMALRHLEHNARKSGADMGMALDVAREAIAEATGGEEE